MLKVVVVENEYYVRKGIIQTFDWDGVGCTIVGEASNGKQGIEVIEETMPDVVIADIEMPVLNGIDMMKWIRNKKLPVDVIFLTAYRDFSYVHQAMKMEAVDYLLKPFRYEDLAACIGKMKARRRDNQLEQKPPLPELHEDFSGYNPYIKEALQFVRKHFGRDFPLSELTDSLGLSESYFCRLFKKETGYTFGQYLNNYRIHVAAGLLANFPMKIHQVSQEVGINDSNYFSQLFRKIMDTTPSEYQMLHKKH